MFYDRKEARDALQENHAMRSWVVRNQGTFGIYALSIFMLVLFLAQLPN